MDLLKKEDIKAYGLLDYLMYSWAEQRFEYVVDWDSEALKECCVCELPWHVDSDEHFEVAFNAGIKYFPQHRQLGFSVCQWAYRKRR